jgi:trehalose 6-phosphate phosphatase
MTPPQLDRTSALFLDLDGTLIEIAATPEAVIVPPGLPGLLSRLHERLDGALAIVSGRPIADTDRLLAPFAAAAAGEHGVSLRYGDGTVEEFPSGVSVPELWRAALSEAVQRWPGVSVEPKPHGVTVHYRQAPERSDEVWRMMRSLVPDDHPWFRLMPAREAVEIGLRTASKGHAVERLMAHPPFRDRCPIFVGDDFTDEAGMSKARDLGGIGVRVADVFGGDPERVRAWLSQGAARLDRPSPMANPRGGSAP